MRAEKHIFHRGKKCSQVGRGYPESKPVETKTSVTRSSEQGPSLVGEAGTENSTKRPPSKGGEEATGRKSGSPSLQAVGGGHTDL